MGKENYLNVVKILSVEKEFVPKEVKDFIFDLSDNLKERKELLVVLKNNMEWFIENHFIDIISQLVKEKYGEIHFEKKLLLFRKLLYDIIRNGIEKGEIVDQIKWNHLLIYTQYPEIINDTSFGIFIESIDEVGYEKFKQLEQFIGGRIEVKTNNQVIDSEFRPFTPYYSRQIELIICSEAKVVLDFFLLKSEDKGYFIDVSFKKADNIIADVFTFSKNTRYWIQFFIDQLMGISKGRIVYFNNDHSPLIKQIDYYRNFHSLIDLPFQIYD